MQPVLCSLRNTRAVAHQHQVVLRELRVGGRGVPGKRCIKDDCGHPELMSACWPERRQRRCPFIIMVNRSFAIHNDSRRRSNGFKKRPIIFPGYTRCLIINLIQTCLRNEILKRPHH